MESVVENCETHARSSPKSDTTDTVVPESPQVERFVEGFAAPLLRKWREVHLASNCICI